MIDMHYDLLTVAYQCYLKDDYAHLETWCKAYCQDNIAGVVTNLYFMSLEEMKEKLGSNYYQLGDSVVDMFQIATNIVSKYLPNTEVLFSIEGCDYIEIDELEPLYNLGLRSIVLVWNNKNKYGSGNRTTEGLTELGRQFLIKAIDLGIGIDLSHANYKTFDGMIGVIQEQKKLGKKVICYASHSNVRNLCNVERNLTEQQLYQIKNVGGLVGALSYIPFVSSDLLNCDDVRKKYMDHIRYLVNILGEDQVVVSTDDMNFCVGFENKNIYPYHNIVSLLKKDLLENFTEQQTYKILYQNAKKHIFKELL